MPAMTAGIIRIAPRAAAATNPPPLKTVTRMTTIRAESAAMPRVQEIPRRRIPSLANAWRRASIADVSTAGT